MIIMRVPSVALLGMSGVALLVAGGLSVVAPEVWSGDNAALALYWWLLGGAADSLVMVAEEGVMASSQATS